MIRRRDLVLALLLALAAGGGSWRRTERLDPGLFVPGPGRLVSPVEWDGVSVSPYGTDTMWFGAETTTTFLTLAEPHYNQSVALRHPLIPLFARLPVRSALMLWPSLEPLAAVRALCALAGAVWAVALFCGLRLGGWRRLDAVAVSVVVLTSAAATFFLGVPDASLFVSVGLLLVCAGVAATGRIAVRSASLVMAGAVLFGFSRAHWVVSVLSAAVCVPWRRATQIAANAFACVLVLWSIQRFVYPTAPFPFAWAPADFTLNLQAIDTSVLDFFMPLVNAIVVFPVGLDVRGATGLPALTVEGVPAGGWPALAAMAVACWVVWLGLGLWALVTMKAQVRLRLFLGAACVFQIAWQGMQGGEAFRYALQSAPLLVLVAGLALFTRFRLLALCLAGALALTGGIHNARQFERALVLIQPFAGSPAPPAAP